jgi:hypothetical protein
MRLLLCSGLVSIMESLGPIMIQLSLMHLLLVAGMNSLQLSNGTIKFGLEFEPIQAVGQLSTIRLTDMRLVVVAGVEPQLAAADEDMYFSVLLASGPETNLILENCTLEVTFDSPALHHLMACEGKQGAQVDVCIHQPSVISVCSISSCQLLSASATSTILTYQRSTLQPVPLTILKQPVSCSSADMPASAWIPVLQVTMTNCKFIGFRRALSVGDKAQVTMKDCLVQLTTQHPYTAVKPVVCGFECIAQQCCNTSCPFILHLFYHEIN